MSNPPVKHALSAFKHRFWLRCGLATSLHTKELLYQELFAWLCERHGIEKRFYPLRSAANHSLLYLLGRIVEENPVRRIVELGAGQTTLLLDGLAPKQGASVLTLEDNEFWAGELRSRVRHEVRVVPLVASRLGEKGVQGYDLTSFSANDRFDLVVVDGPLGRPKASRSGCLDLLDAHLADEFVVVFDDAERRGERQTIDRARALLKAKCPGLREMEVLALKRQVVLMSDAFQRIAWY